MDNYVVAVDNYIWGCWFKSYFSKQMKNLNSGGNKSGKRKMTPEKEYSKDKMGGDFPLLEVVIVIILIIAYILWKNYPK